MGLLNFIGKGLDLVSDFIPGANLVQSAVEAVIPQAESFFEGTLGSESTTSSSAGTVASVTTGGSTMQLPVLNMGSGTSSATLPSVAAAQTSAVTSSTNTGILPWWKGADGKLQLPWNDPNIAEYLKPYSLDDAYLKTYVRAPKGFVVVRDANGKPYAVQKQMAKLFGIWKPAAKPPISATDWKHYKRNKQISKRIAKIAQEEIREARKSARASAQRKKTTRR